MAPSISRWLFSYLRKYFLQAARRQRRTVEFERGIRLAYRMTADSCKVHFPRMLALEIETRKSRRRLDQFNHRRAA